MNESSFKVHSSLIFFMLEILSSTSHICLFTLISTMVSPASSFNATSSPPSSVSSPNAVTPPSSPREELAMELPLPPHSASAHFNTEPVEDYRPWGLSSSSFWRPASSWAIQDRPKTRLRCIFYRLAYHRHFELLHSSQFTIHFLVSFPLKLLY